MKKLIYYIYDKLLFAQLESKIVNLLKKEKKLVIFDVGCFKGVFSRRILHLIKKRKFKFYLFDVNKNTKTYISDLLLSKHFKFNEVALTNKNGTAEFNFNRFFESSGSSLSTLFKNDARWVFSRKLILKILLQKTKDIFNQRNKFKEKELKEFSILYLIINNLDIFRKNIELISDINFSTELLMKFKSLYCGRFIFNSCATFTSNRKLQFGSESESEHVKNVHIMTNKNSSCFILRNYNKNILK